ncbi:MAG TPA: hypothetical protein VF314_01550 [Actinomycetes bacterium]
MSARQDRGVVVTTPDVVVSTAMPAQPTAGRGSSRWSWWSSRRVLAVAVLLAGVAAAVIAAMATDGEQPLVAEPASRPTAGAAGPGSLRLTVHAPTRAVAGQEVVIEVRYAAGDGRFTGSTVDWGDGLGTSSVRVARCDGVPTAPTPLAGSYRLAHTWAEPGTYTVELGATSATCTPAGPVEQQASERLAIEVVAP